PATTKHVGVRIKFIWSGTDTSLACGSGALVDCFDNGSPDGLVHIRAYPAGVAGTVHLEQVYMLAGTCSGAYFAISATNSCGPGVQAQVDLGNHPVNQVWAANCATGCAQVWATVDGNQYQLTPTTTPGSGLITWQ